MIDDLFEDDSPEFYEDNEEVMNSSLFSTSNVGDEYFNNIFGNTNLKNGIIIKIYEIDDELNLNKKFPEYDVLVVEQKAMSSVEPVIYKNCITIDGFGGVADFFEFKRRSKKEEKGKQSPLDTNFKDQFGSMVFLLCLDGATDKGVIINSVPHPGRKTKLTKDAGLHLEGEYNGLNWQINKDGELTIVFKSKTDDEGKPQDEDAGGTHLKIDKEGSVDINTNLEGDEETYIRMDKKNKDVGLKAGQHIGFTAKKNIGLEAEGAAKFTSKSSLDIEGKSDVNIKSGNVKIAGDTLTQIDGQNLVVNCTKIQLGSGGTPAVIQTTIFQGTGNKGAPVISQAIGPFSSSVTIAT